MRTTFRRIAVLAALGAFVAGCGRSGSDGATGPVRNPDTFTYLTISDIDSLDGAWSYDTASHEAILQVYEGLVFYKDSSVTEFEPRIATEVPSRGNGLLSKDGRTYRFPIRKGVRFHDGSALTPDDVKWSLMRFCLQDRDGGPSALLLEPLVGYANTRKDGKPKAEAFTDLDRAIQVKGDEVLVTLKEPFAPFMSILAQFGMIMPRAWGAGRGDWDGTEAAWRKHNNPKKEDSPFFEGANGTGPFKLERWSKETKELILLRHDDYWREPAKIKRFITKGVDEFATRKLMLSAGDADAIYADRLVYPDVATIPGVTIIDDLPIVEMNPTVFFTFKIEPVANPDIGSGKLDGGGIPPDFFADADVRKAFAHTLDYGAYIKDIARGKGTQARGCVPKTLLGYDESLPVYDFDLKKAEEHFKKAHGGKVWENGFHFSITYNSGNVPRQVMAQMLKRNVEGLNPKFKIETRGVQWSTYLAGITAHKAPLFIMGWGADYPDPHNFAHPFLHSHGHWAEIQRFSDDRIDRLIDQGRRELDEGKRKAIYMEMQRLAYELAPQLYVIDSVRYRTQRSWVKGFVHNPIWPSAPYSSYMYPVSKGDGAEPVPAAASR